MTREIIILPAFCNRNGTYTLYRAAELRRKYNIDVLVVESTEEILDRVPISNAILYVPNNLSERANNELANIGYNIKYYSNLAAATENYMDRYWS